MSYLTDSDTFKRDRPAMASTHTRDRSRTAKILIAGTGAVGKTSLVRVLKEGRPLDSAEAVLPYRRTPFLNLETIQAKELGASESQDTYLMVDVAGQLGLPIHALRDLGNIATRNIDLVLLVFSADNLQSLLELQNWIQTVKNSHAEGSTKPLRFVLLMNKCDLKREMDRGLVEALLKSEPKIEQYFEISCKTGAGLQELSSWLVLNVSI
ncbi:MAG: GTPase domain-containing protein [Candidatus Thorarchaeota archaeon]|nr:GTPase domain-containing protein [Candidatus Thorarchaeota archaeon]